MSDQFKLPAIVRLIVELRVEGQIPADRVTVSSTQVYKQSHAAVMDALARAAAVDGGWIPAPDPDCAIVFRPSYVSDQAITLVIGGLEYALAAIDSELSKAPESELCVYCGRDPITGERH